MSVVIPSLSGRVSVLVLTRFESGYYSFVSVLNCLDSCVEEYTFYLELGNHSAKELFLAGVIEMKKVRVVPWFAPKFAP